MNAGGATSSTQLGPGELVFTGEQLTLLGDLAGQPGFPFAQRPALDEAGWGAVARSLAARGVIHDDDESSPVRLADAVLGLVLAADRWFAVTVIEGDGDGDEPGIGHDILWLKGDLRVRQTVSPEGFHRFWASELDELLAGVLELTDADAPPQRILRFEAVRKVGDDSVEGAAIVLLRSSEHGLCLVADEPDDPGSLAPISPEDARAEVTALAATLG